MEDLQRTSAFELALPADAFRARQGRIERAQRGAPAARLDRGHLSFAEIGFGRSTVPGNSVQDSRRPPAGPCARPCSRESHDLNDQKRISARSEDPRATSELEGRGRRAEGAWSSSSRAPARARAPPRSACALRQHGMKVGGRAAREGAIATAETGRAFARFTATQVEWHRMGEGFHWITQDARAATAARAERRVGR